MTKNLKSIWIIITWGYYYNHTTHIPNVKLHSWYPSHPLTAYLLTWPSQCWHLCPRTRDRSLHCVPSLEFPLAAFWIFLTSCDEPRGMIRSISFSKWQRSSASSLVITCESCDTNSQWPEFSSSACAFYTCHSKKVVDLILNTYKLHCIFDSVNGECFSGQTMKDLIAICSH